MSILPNADFVLDGLASAGESDDAWEDSFVESDAQIGQLDDDDDNY